jgi:hypothetical protein
MWYEFNMFDCKPLSTPLKVEFKLNYNMSSLESKNTNVMQEVPSFMVVGCLMHVMTHPCPNLAYHASQVAKYMENACQAHWFDIKLIITDIKGTSNYGITY